MQRELKIRKLESLRLSLRAATTQGVDFALAGRSIAGVWSPGQGPGHLKDTTTQTLP